MRRHDHSSLPAIMPDGGKDRKEASLEKTPELVVKRKSSNHSEEECELGSTKPFVRLG